MFFGITPHLLVSATVFSLGLLGFFLNRRHIISLLMSLELILLSVNLNFITFSADLYDLTGQVFSLFILTIAAAEAAIGLAILVVYFRNRGTITLDESPLLRG